MSPNDIIRLNHIIDAANEIQSFIVNRSRKDLIENRMLVLSIVKDIEIIGEAASRLSIPFKEKYNNLPWQDIIGMRNQLVHGYYEIDLDIVWATVTEDIPLILEELILIKNDLEKNNN